MGVNSWFSKSYKNILPILYFFFHIFPFVIYTDPPVKFVSYCLPGEESRGEVKAAFLLGGKALLIIQATSEVSVVW